MIKGDGGAIGLTENPTALKRWMVAGPEVSRMVAQYENIADVKQGRHNQDDQTTQKRFGKELQTLTSVIQNMGNPFNESSKDLLILSSRNIVQASNSIKEIVAQGYEQYKKHLSKKDLSREVFHLKISWQETRYNPSVKHTKS